MAEGMTRLNQQVVDAGYWDRSDRLAPIGEQTASHRRELLDARSQDPACDDVRRAVEADIVPRLLLSRERSAQDKAEPSLEGRLGEADVLRFTELLLAPGADLAIEAQLAEIQARGVGIDQIYLHLFQPAARHIGELWLADICTFVDVTLALGAMQTQMRTFGPIFHKTARPADASRQALLVPLHGDQHTFGLWMVAEFFRRAGWNVWGTSFASGEALGEAVRDTWFTVVGLSASCEERLDDLAAAIRTVRQQSCNRAIGILVGGPLFLDHPEHVLRVGADAWGADAREALAQAEGFAALKVGP